MTRLRPPSKPESVLYQTFVAADLLRQKALAAGDSRADADAIVIGALKAAWPKSRVEPWHYVCDTCEDTGFEFQVCQTHPCDRQKPHLPHTYVRYCWCSKGRALQPKPKHETDELAQVGKMTKPSRFGSR